MKLKQPKISKLKLCPYLLKYELCLHIKYMLHKHYTHQDKPMATNKEVSFFLTHHVDG